MLRRGVRLSLSRLLVSSVPRFSQSLRFSLVPVSPTANILLVLKFHFALHAYGAAPPGVSRIPVS